MVRALGILVLGFFGSFKVFLEVKFFLEVLGVLWKSLGVLEVLGVLWTL